MSLRQQILPTLALAALSATGAEPRLNPATAARDVIFQPVTELQHPVGLELYFSPSDNTEQVVVAAIDAARSEILVSQHAVLSSAMLDALQRAFGRKCVVMALVDPPAAGRDNGAADLARRKIPTVPARSARGNAARYLLVDREKVLLVTADLAPTPAAPSHVLMSFREPSIVISFYNHFVSEAFPSPESP